MPKYSREFELSVTDFLEGCNQEELAKVEKLIHSKKYQCRIYPERFSKQLRIDAEAEK